MANHAVITDNMLVWISEERRQVKIMPPDPIEHAADLWQVGQDMRVTHFWVMPGCRIDLMGWDFYAPREGFKLFVPGVRDENVAPHAAAYGKGPRSFEIFVNYPARGNGFGWVIDKPLDILAAVDYLAQLLEMDDLKYSPQHIGRTYLKQGYAATKRLQSYVEPCKDDLSKYPFRQAAPEIYFTQPPLLMAEDEGKWVHTFDKNAAHPSAASSMVTGIGHLSHVDTNHIDLKKPGIYRILSFDPAGSRFDGEKLPRIIESEWVTCDVLKFAIKEGYRVDIGEAYCFDQGYNIFGAWARNLWSIRQRLKDESQFLYEPGRLNAYDTLKDVMNTTISASKGNANWWADMVGMSRVARLANLATFAGHPGVLPLYVYCDDMGYISREQLPNVAVPGILDRMGKLGGYKVKFSFQLSGEHIMRLNTFCQQPHGAAALKIHGYLKKVAREKGLIDE